MLLLLHHLYFASYDCPFSLPVLCRCQNICRSPTAEAVFRAVVERAGLASQFEIDSCGTGVLAFAWSSARTTAATTTIQHFFARCSVPVLLPLHHFTGGGSSNWYLAGGFSYHEGDPADPRMTSVAAKRGVRLTSRSRPLAPADLSTFDVILGMDASNLRAIRRAADHWRSELLGGKELVPVDWEARLCLMTDYLRDAKFKRYTEVPDPYYVSFHGQGSVGTDGTGSGTPTNASHCWSTLPCSTPTCQPARPFARPACSISLGNRAALLALSWYLTSLRTHVRASSRICVAAMAGGSRARDP